MTPRWYLHFAWGRPPYALDLPEVVIGRGEGCPLQIEEPSAHEEHARFVVDDQEHVWLEPLGADRPTLQNGRKIAGRVRLSDGDFIQIGHAVLTLRAAGAQPVATAPTDARTVQGSELPEEVRRAVAAKNFVVGQSEPAPMATLMMESPLISTGNNHSTTEMPAAPTVVSTAPSAPLPSQRGLSKPTLIGVGPGEMASAPTMIASIPTPAPQPALRRDESARTVITEQGSELAAAPTMIGALPTPPRPRGSTQTDITPLPAPLPPPNASHTDLRPLVAAATSKAESFDDSGEATRTEISSHPVAPLNSAATQPLAAVDVTMPLSAQKTMPPTAVPLSERKTMPPVQAPSQVSGQAANQVSGQVPSQAPSQAPGQVSGQKAGKGPASTDRLPPLPPPPVAHDAAYVAPAKGPFGSFSRAIDFFQQMLTLARRERAIVKPIIYDLLIATPVSLAVAALLLVVSSPAATYAILGLGTAALYFIDYFCNAMTASLMYDYVQTGRADLVAAKGRVRRSLGGIATFAAVSALLDVAATYARERNDLVAKIILRVLRAIWSTATYVVMPAMVIEGVPFKDAFARSKRLMDQDPTGVGAGVVALSLCSYILGAVLFSLAYFLMQVGARVHPILGVMLYFTVVNLYWALSGWMKIAYSTCFYVWAQRCEAEGRADETLAPIPLRHALDAG